MKRRRFAWVLAAATALAAAGCAGYRLGPTNGAPAGERTVQVLPFENQTLEPRLVEPVVSALRRRLQQDGTFRLATRGDADIVVEGTLLRYRRRSVSYEPGDIRSVRDYDLRLTAHVKAYEAAGGRVLLDRDVTARTTVRLAGDQPSAERQAAPLLADDLARRITSLLVDGTW
ncbi:MAG: hypothetical protein J7M29_01105 [Verrucomicrobia bacterium]|nr:hypothetical protein [Verrucomicrobiota bacterium]